MPKNSLPSSEGENQSQPFPKQTTSSTKSRSQSSSKSHNIDSPKSHTSTPHRNNSSHSHTHPTHRQTPPLVTELQKVDGVVKERSYPPKLIDESASLSSAPSPPCSTFNLGVEVPKMSHDFTQLLKVSQVSKLLSAFSTWVSIPPSNAKSSFQSHDSQVSCDSQVPRDGGRNSEFHDNDAEEKESDNARTPAKDVAVFLPLVDSVNVRQVQHKLFVSQMRKHLSEVCSKLGLLFHTILPRVTLTVAKFRLVKLQLN